MNAKMIQIMGLGLDPRALPFAKCVTGKLLTLPSVSLLMSHIDKKILTP